jgi:hypothetical protein
MYPAFTEAADPGLSTSTATDLAALLRRIFWLVHTIKTWETNASETAGQNPISLLASAPFREWSEVARQIQSDIKPENWKIERKENNGQPARTIISLRKHGQPYEVELLPLKGFKPSQFFYDYRRGHLLQILAKGTTDPTLLHINPTGLYYENKLVITNPPDQSRFLGLSVKPLHWNYTPHQLYSEIAASPFFDPYQFFEASKSQGAKNPPTETLPGAVIPQSNICLKAFTHWAERNHLHPAQAESPGGKISRDDIEQRLHCIRAGIEPAHRR